MQFIDMTSKLAAVLYVAAAGLAGWAAYVNFQSGVRFRGSILAAAAVLCLVMAVVRGRQ
jgi:hypothetical protein